MKKRNVKRRLPRIIRWPDWWSAFISEDIKSSFNPIFRHYCARINSAFDGPPRAFPSRAILDGVYLDGAGLSLSTIIGTRLTFAKFCRANLEESNLAFACLHRTDLIGANLYNANLIGANLNSANLNSASLSSARLDGASLNGAVLRTAVGLTREQIELARIDEQTALPEDLEKVKPEILELQRLSREELGEISALAGPGSRGDWKTGGGINN
jgi:pentapeptide repeat protein